MLTVDTRAGSERLIEPLREAGLVVAEGILPAGDVEILGEGPAGLALIGIEYKTWGDALACMRDGRFATQLRGMRRAYEFSWLVVEGQIRVGPKGLIHSQNKAGRWAVAHGNYTYQEAAAWLMTMAARAGVQLWRTENLTETVAWVKSLYCWWTAKEWKDHRAHLDFYRPPVAEGELFEEPPLVQVVASTLPGLGAKRAEAVAREFKTVREMVEADEERWRRVEGIGPKIAKTLVSVLCEGEGRGR